MWWVKYQVQALQVTVLVFLIPRAEGYSGGLSAGTESH